MSRSRASSFASSLSSALTSSDPEGAEDENDSILDEPTVSLSRSTAATGGGAAATAAAAAPLPPAFNPSSASIGASGSTTRVPLRDHSSLDEAGNGSGSGSRREGMMGHESGDGSGAGGVTELEERVLNEYERLLENLNALSARLHALSSMPTAEVLDELRSLERKIGLVFTLLKASVYSIVLQQEVVDAPPLD